MAQRFIDVRSRLPVKEHLSLMGSTDEEETDEEMVWSETYDSVYNVSLEELKEDPVGAYAESMDELNIEKKLIPDAEYVYHLIEDYLDRFIPMASVDVVDNTIAEEVEVLESKVTEEHYGAVQLLPVYDGIFANDPKYYPIYQTADELGVPVWIHTSANFTTDKPNTLGHPQYVEEVAIDFPELPIICGHGGWPRVAEVCALAWKHENILIDFTAQRARYVASNTDWAPLMEYGQTVIQDSILFGTSYPLVDDKTQIEDVFEMDLDAGVQQRWCYDNAARILPD